MATRVTFTFYGQAQIDRTLESISLRAEDATSVWEAIADRFLDDEARQFDTEGGYGSGRWPALSPKYADWKAKHYPGRGILVRTGELRDSLTKGPQVRAITSTTMVIGSAVDYGKYHQRGDGVPQRRPVELPEDERQAWAKAIQRFVMTGEAIV